MRASSTWLLLGALTALAPGARAEDGPSGGDAEGRARAFFEDGKQAMSVGRFADASDLFRRSLELVPRASPAFNLAVALRGMGKPKEASDVLGALVAGRYGDLPAERHADAERLLGEVRRDVATVDVVGTGATSIEIRVDGVLAGVTQSGESLSVPVNPGEHVVVLSAKLRENVERHVIVAAGGKGHVSATLALSREARRATLTVVAEKPDDIVEIVGVARGTGSLTRKLDPATYALRVTSHAGTRDAKVRLLPATDHRVVLDSPKSALMTSPWFWAAAGTLVAAGAVGGYFAFRPGQASPVRDPEFQITQTLGAAR